MPSPINAKPATCLALLIPRDRINYRARDGVQIIPYVSLDITDGGKNSPIQEVVLGPKNPNKEADVEKFLTDAGWKGVKVLRSDIPYV